MRLATVLELDWELFSYFTETINLIAIREILMWARKAGSLVGHVQLTWH